MATKNNTTRELVAAFVLDTIAGGASLEEVQSALHCEADVLTNKILKRDEAARLSKKKGKPDA
jgi:hypothetical protein